MRLHKSFVAGTVTAVAVLGLTGTAQAGEHEGHGRDRGDVVKVRDDCDPATFPSDIGCSGDGDTTFEDFLAEFEETGAVEGWDFRPWRLRVDEGETVTAVNVGGEFHTFTRVKRFGPGCVPELNMGKRPIKECRDPAVAEELFALTGLAPGETVEVSDERSGPRGFNQALKPGKNRFECLIHPWMRAVIVVHDDHHGHR